MDREQFLSSVFDQTFRGKGFAKKYGLPQVLEDLLLALFKSMRSD